MTEVYQRLTEQQRLLFMIGQRNRARGFRPTGVGDRFQPDPASPVDPPLSGFSLSGVDVHAAARCRPIAHLPAALSNTVSSGVQ